MIDYNNISIPDFITHLKKIHTENQSDTLNILDNISKHERYENDIEFKLAILIFYIFTTAAINQYEACFSYIKKMQDLSIHINDVELLIHAHLAIAYAYWNVNLIDNSMQNYLMVCKIEAQRDIFTISSSVAYNNIATIYVELSIFDKAIDYYKLAIENNEKLPPSDKVTFYNIVCNSNIAALYYKLNQPERAIAYLNLAQTLFDNNPQLYKTHFLDYAHMHRTSESHDFSSMKQYFNHMHDKLFNEDNINTYSGIFTVYYELCKQHHLDESYYKDYILAFENMLSTHGHIIKSTPIYQLIIDYYTVHQNETKILDTYAKLSAHIQQINDHVIAQRAMTMDIHFELQKTHEEGLILKEKNNMLEPLNQNLKESKDKLQILHDQLMAISDINHHIISSTDINYIVRYIHDTLSQLMPTDVFIIALIDDATRTLQTKLHYEDCIKQAPVDIDIHDPDSFLAKCYRENKLIHLDKLHIKDKKNIIQGKGKLRTFLYAPITYDNKTVGVFSIQALKTNAYDESDIQFINFLMPYLAIALNHAKKSEQLKAEILSNKKTQQELSQRHQELLKMSDYDTLTGIYNKRAFNAIAKELIEAAIKQQQMIHIYMLDIDHFKSLNDTHGHLTGDNVLIKISRHIQQLFAGKHQVFARFGGEEFIAIAVGLSDDDAFIKAENIRNGTSEISIYCPDGTHTHIHLSVGLASFNTPIQLNDMIHKADKALYQAKNSGRNKVVHILHENY